MELRELTNLKADDRLTVTFGSRGEQQARFVRYGICQGHSSLVVNKYRKASKRWTGNVHVLPGDIVRKGW